MGLSLEEANALGIGHLHPDHPGNAGPGRAAIAQQGAATAAPAQRPGTVKNERGQNKTEADLDAWLAKKLLHGQVAGYAFEPLKLWIGPRTWLRIDFAVARKGKPIAFVDVKGGPVEDDAAVKLKVAAERHAWLGEVWIVRREGRHGWLFQRVCPHRGFAETVMDDLWL